MTINELVIEAHGTAKSKGWHDTQRNLGEALALIHSEISEALEEARRGTSLTEISYHANNPDKPEGFGVELADAVIRIADLCGAVGINLEQMIKLKMEYNKTRPHRHGKVF